MNDEQLQAWVERVSTDSFGLPFLHKATFNRRLRSTGGRYFMKSHHIEISWQHYEEFGDEETERIIKHELCHYHLHLARRGYKHGDTDFKSLLAAVGGSRYCKPLAAGRRRERVKYKLLCGSCGMEYERKRKCDPRRYACGRCRGKLQLLSLDSNSNS